MGILRENLRFKQLRLNYIHSQKKQTEKEHLRLVISSIRVGVVAKTDDEVYVSSTIKMYSYFSFVFSTVPKKVQLLKISKVMQLLRKSLPHAKMIEKKTINFSVSPKCTLLFFRKENITFSEVALVAVHYNCLISYLMIA